MDADFDMAGMLERLRNAATYVPQSKGEVMEMWADWWDALWHELEACRHETLTGGPNHRVGSEDTEHAMQMAVWLRWEVLDMKWREERENQWAVDEWNRVKPKTNDAKAIEEAKERLGPEAKQRLLSRPRAPDRPPETVPPTQPIPRPRDYLPIGWPPIDVKPKPWSIYLGWLLTEKRARAGIVEREPGEDREEDDDAAQ